MSNLFSPKVAAPTPPPDPAIAKAEYAKEQQQAQGVKQAALKEVNSYNQQFRTPQQKPQTGLNLF